MCIRDRQEGGARNLVGPVFYGDDPSAEVLGLLYGHDLPGLITKNIAKKKIESDFLSKKDLNRIFEQKTFSKN